MLHTKFRGNRPAGSEKKIFKGLFTIYGHSGNLGHVTSIMSSDIYFKDNKYGSNRQSRLRKSGLKFCMYTTLGQGLEMILTFNTHIPSYI